MQIQKEINSEFDAIELERHHAELQAEDQHLQQRFLSRHLWRGFGASLRFVATTALIFAISFIGLNFTAFAKQFDFWLNAESMPAELTSSVLNAVAEPTELKAAASVELAADQSSNIENKKLPVHEIIQQAASQNLPNLQLAIVPPESYIFIPRLGIRAPIREAQGIEYFGDWNYIEQQIQEALRGGVVRFPGTAEPGERGNSFLTGHSSYYPWDTGRYKDIFALLPKIKLNDEIIIFHKQKKFKYVVSNIREVNPNQTDVLGATDDYRLTLMTCTPVGTTLRRLIVTAQLVGAPTSPLALK